MTNTLTPLAKYKIPSNYSNPFLEISNNNILVKSKEGTVELDNKLNIISVSKLDKLERDKEDDKVEKIKTRLLESGIEFKNVYLLGKFIGITLKEQEKHKNAKIEKDASNIETNSNIETLLILDQNYLSIIAKINLKITEITNNEECLFILSDCYLYCFEFEQKEKSLCDCLFNQTLEIKKDISREDFDFDLEFCDELSFDQRLSFGLVSADEINLDEILSEENEEKLDLVLNVLDLSDLQIIKILTYLLETISSTNHEYTSRVNSLLDKTLKIKLTFPKTLSTLSSTTLINLLTFIVKNFKLDHLEFINNLIDVHWGKFILYNNDLLGTLVKELNEIVFSEVEVSRLVECKFVSEIDKGEICNGGVYSVERFQF